MSDTIGTAQIEITGDASGFDASAKEVKKTLAGIGDSAKKAGKDSADGMGQAEGSSKKLEAATKRTAASIERQALAMGRTKSEYYAAKAAIDGNAKALEPYIAKLREVEKNAASMAQAQKGIADTSIATSKAFGAIAATLSVAKFIQMADSVTALNNQLKLATGSTTAAAAAYESLFEIAQRSRVSFTELGGTYASIARAGSELGISQNRLLKVTEAIGNAMTISGGSAASMQAALVQLSQGLASGTLRGEELNSVMEQTPRLAKALADGMGVSVGKLREMGAAGEITAERVIQALESQTAALQREVGNATLSVGQAFTQLQNSATKFVGDADKATGASAALAKALSAASSALDGVGKTINENGTLIASTMGALAGAATIAGLASLAGGLGKVAVGIKAISLALAANPATLALLGIGAAVGGFVAYNSAQSKTVEGMRRTLKELETLNRDAVNSPYYSGASDTATNKLIEERKRQIDTLRQAVAEMDAQNLDTRGEDARLARYAQAAKASQSLSDSLTEATQRNAGLTKAMGQYYADLEIYQKAREAGKITEQEYIKLVSDLAVQYGEKSKKVKENKDAEKELNAERKRSFDVIAERNKLVEQAAKQESAYQAALEGRNFDAAFDAQEKARLATEEQIKTGREYLEQIEFETRLIDMNTEQRAIATAVRELESKGIVAGTKAYDAYIDKIKEAIKLRDGKTVAAEQAKEAADEWKKTAERIEQDLTDALMRGFESGKDFAQVLRDTVVNMFKTLVLRPIISAVVNPVAGALTGSLGLAGVANAGQGGNLLGTSSNLSSAYDTLSNGVSNAVSAGFDKLATSGFGQKIGLSDSIDFGTGYEQVATNNTGATLGQYAGMAGNALAGYGLQKAISGGYKTGESGLVDAITVAASAYFGPIAGVAAGAFNRAFGRKLTDQGLQGQFGGEAGFTGENYQFLKGGWFRSDKTKTSALDADMQSGLANQFKALQVQTALMATVLGDTGQSVADFTSSIKLSFNGLTEAQIGEKLAETFTGIANDLAKTVLGDSAFAKEGEAASQTLQRLANSLTTVNGTFDALGFSLQAVSLAGADAASDFIDLIGGLDAFKAATAGYFANFYSETERQAQATEQLTAQLAGLGQALPATRDGFRAMVEAAEKAGNTALLAGLLNLQDEFAALVPAAEDAAAAVSSAVTSLKAETTRLQRDLLAATGGDVRGFDTKGMSAAEVAIYDYNQSLRDQIDAANAATQANDAAAEAARARAEAVAAERDGLNRRLLEATGDTAAIRALELEALDASNRAIQEHIWAIEDAAAAYEKATTAAQASYSTLERSADAERGKLTDAYTVERDAITERLKIQQQGYQAQIEAAQTAADKIRDIAGALSTAVGQVRVDSPTFNRAAYDAARGVIGTSDINDPRLKAALDAVSGDNKQFYGRFEDYAFEQAVTAANIRSMDAAAQSQLSAADAMIQSLKASDTLAQVISEAELAALEEKHNEQLAQLQDQLDLGKSQLDALLGIDTRVLSVADAITELGGAISAAYAAQSAQSAAAMAATSAALSSAPQDTGVVSGDAERVLGYMAKWVNFANDTRAAGNEAFGSIDAIRAGALDYTSGLSADKAAIAAMSNSDLADLLKSLGVQNLPSFDVGINSVPRDMVAKIHKGEAVVPAQFNPFNPGAQTYGGNSEQVVAELRQLNERMARIEATNAATAGHTAAADRKLARVIKNDAITTEAATA